MPQGKISREHRIARHQRVRKKVSGTAQRPRLAVFRSLKHIYAQAIDDEQGCTLATASSLEVEVRNQRASKNKTQLSREVGALVARRLKGQGVLQVVLDRGGFQYHGRVKALADAAREEGMKL